jgi:mRNA interferase RelE/StbE
MNVLFDKSFYQDIKAIHHPGLQNRLRSVIERIEQVESIQSLNVKKLSGAKNSYRMRIGDYRLGFEVNGPNVVLVRFLHRKDIYKYFP